MERRRALITGGARGIGAVIAAALREDGLEVLTPDRAALDLSSVDSVQRYVHTAGGALEVDVLVNNAGENKINLIGDLALSDWQRILTVNLTASFLLIQAAAPYMARRGWGRIVNLSSIYSLLSRPGRAAYSASKSGLNGLTRAVALEYGPRQVLCNAICPGFVETDMTRQNNTPEKLAELAGLTALGRLAQPREIAELCRFLCSERSSYITGQTLVIDGGFSCQ